MSLQATNVRKPFPIKVPAGGRSNVVALIKSTEVSIAKL